MVISDSQLGFYWPMFNDYFAGGRMSQISKTGLTYKQLDEAYVKHEKEILDLRIKLKAAQKEAMNLKEFSKYMQVEK